MRKDLFVSRGGQKRWGLKSLMSRILTQFPSIHGKELSLKYADTLNDWIELPADDLDSFVDMIKTAKDSARENPKPKSKCAN